MTGRPMDPLVELLGESPGIVAVRKEIGRLLAHSSSARRVASIVIQGETGTGKGLIARAIHRAGPRAAGPFVEVNCAAIPETLLEAELFGFERGAFTDARQAKPGLFQMAHDGTLFLDEIGLMPVGLQPKLLKALEDHAVRRLGGTRNEPVNVWILAATSENLVTATREQRFRADLYHRLAAVTIALPPLRERGNDIILLAEHFLSRACADYSLARKMLADDARACLTAYSWPGNVRELANVMERVALLSEEPQVTAAMLHLQEAPAAAGPRPAAPERGATSLDDAVRKHMLDTLNRTNWNISRSAALLGISRNTLRARIEKYDLRHTTKPATAASPSHQHMPVLPTASPPPPRLTEPRWTRRRFTVLKAVLVDDQPNAPHVRVMLQTLVEKVRVFGGRLEGMSPGGLVAIFGIEPIEDAPLRAAHAAMAMQNAAEHAQRESEVPQDIKVGIHVGQYLAADTGNVLELELEAKRDALTVLQTLVEHAEPHSVLVTESAVPFLERRFEVIPVEVRQAAAGRVFRVTARAQPGFRVSGRSTLFVGRSHELALLNDRMASVANGRGHVVGLVGEPGIGKSRLLHEFRQGLQAELVTYLEGRCVSYGTSIPFLPIIEVLRQACDLTENDGPETTVNRVRGTLERLGLDADDSAPFILQLFGIKEGVERLSGLSAEVVRDRTLSALQQMSINSSRQRPFVVAIEDLHWVDSASDAFLSSLIDSVPGAAILIVLTYRPWYRSSALGRSYATQIALPALSAQESTALAESILRPYRVPENEAQTIAAKTEGNPFFIEELARAIAERGQSAGTVPASIHAVLSARIDQLGDEPKRLLQMASVVGRRISLPLLTAMCGSSDNPRPHLQDLTEREFLYVAREGDESTYVFKHALTQEVAYDSLLPAERQELHTTVGRALERLYASRVDEICDLLAYHYSKSPDTAKAVNYLSRSSQNAARRYAHVEAVTALQEARARLRTLPVSADGDRAMIDYVLREAHSLHLLGRMAEAMTLLDQHGDIVGRLDDPRLTGQYNFWVARSHSVLGDRDRAASHLATAIASAEQAADSMTLGTSYFLLAFEDFWVGRLALGIQHARQAVDRLSSPEQPWWLGMSYWALALNCLVFGDLPGATEATEHVARLGSGTGDPRLQSCASWMRGWIHATRGEWQPAIASCEQAQRQAKDPGSLIYATGQLASALLDSGAADKAVPLFEKAISDSNQLRPAARQTQSRFMALLAEAYAMSGDVQRAEATAVEAFRLAESVRHTYAMALAVRAQARAVELRGQLEEADQRLVTALGLFKTIRAACEVARGVLRRAELAAAGGDVGHAVEAANSARDAFRFLGMHGYEAAADRLLSTLA